MSYSNYQLNQRINNLQQQINSGINILSNNNTFTGTNDFTQIPTSITTSGAINASSIKTSNLTPLTTTALSIGTTIATSVNIGASGIITSINGLLNLSDTFINGDVPSSVNNLASGRISYERFSGSNNMGSASLWNSYVVLVNNGTGGTGGTITLPTVASAKGYTITVRSVQSTKNTTVNNNGADTACILIIGASSYDIAGSVSTTTVNAGQVKTFFSDGSFWIQI
jgi:hypothetical protein